MKSHRLHFLAVIAIIGLIDSRASANLIITPTWDPTITSDPNAATIESTILSAIDDFQDRIQNNVNIGITFVKMNSGLGQSSKSLYALDFVDYMQALNGASTSLHDQVALANIPSSSKEPVTGHSQILVRTANMKALGSFGLNLPATDGTVGLRTSICNLSRTGPWDIDKYDLYAVACHEIDEILGTGSWLPRSNFNDAYITPQDLFRYDQQGKHTFTTSGSGRAFLSLDGHYFIDEFNNYNNGGDFGDWIQHYSSPQVQDWAGTPGERPEMGVGEWTSLDVVGFTILPYRKTILPTATGLAGFTTGASSSYQVGYASVNGVRHAFEWGTSATPTDLHPTGATDSIAYGVSGAAAVGSFTSLAIGGSPHAVLWTQGASVDLNPSWASASEAYAASGFYQVGKAVDATSNLSHATLWTGSANSAIDLNPPGFAESFAFAAGEGVQGGSARLADSNTEHASLWYGSSASFVDLHPTGYLSSRVNSVSSQLQAGSAREPRRQFDHAILWRGTVDSFIDLNPSDFSASVVLGTTNDTQVGYGWSAATGGASHALVWHGTADSVVDLHPSRFASSVATGISDNGDIVGYGVDSNGTQQALLWKYDGPSLRGKVTLSNFSGDSSRVAISITFFSKGTSTPLATTTAHLAADGTFSIPSSYLGDVDVVIKAGHWLSVRKPVSLTDFGGSVNATLVNGDIDGNNGITIIDYAALSDAFGTTLGQKEFDFRADLDGNGIVNINDYTILSDNFNQYGQP